MTNEMTDDLWITAVLAELLADCDELSDERFGGALTAVEVLGCLYSGALAALEGLGRTEESGAEPIGLMLMAMLADERANDRSFGAPESSLAVCASHGSHAETA